jgi:transcriptional regulator with XRE-family HTH domain
MANPRIPTKLTKIERYILQKAVEKRLEANISQEKLSILIGKNRSFVGHVEARRNGAKYNINHVNDLAEALDCSPYDFIPDKPFRNNDKK